MKRTFTPLLLLSLALNYVPVAVADTTDDACVGPTALLAIVDRPTISDSPCTVAEKHAVLEMGTQVQQLYPDHGGQFNLPEAELRIGLPAHTEFLILLPNYIHQSVSPNVGVTASVMGIKHRLSSTAKMQTAIEGLLTPPSGSDNLGSRGWGGAINGILSYNITDTVNFTFMFGVSSLSQSSQQGGRQFTSANPDAVLTYTVNDKTNIYLEAYGQSKTGSGQGAGFNSDAGVIYLLRSNLTVDAEIGQRISGLLGGFSRYVGVGMAVAF